MLIFICFNLPAQAAEKQKITLQLKWTHAFQFAGYYAAKEKGFYDQAGLDVTIKEAQPESDVISEVLSGRAQFGTGTNSLLLARQADQPVTVLAVIFQHSPLVILALTDEKKVKTIHDLVGKRIMFEKQSEELIAYLQRERISPKDIRFIPHSFDIRDLTEGRVDAISAYVTNETFYLEKENILYQVLDPRASGIDFYGDNLFTSEYMIKNNPEAVAAFRSASLKGWHYAMTHKDEVADIIFSRYSSKHPKDFYLHEALAMDDMLKPELVEIGYMNIGRWQHIVEIYQSLGMLKPDFSLDGFLYDEKPKEKTVWFRTVGFPAAAVLVLTISIYLIFIFRRMKGKIAREQEIIAKLNETEQLNKSLLENSTAAIYMLKGSKIIHGNSAIAEITGYQKDELLEMEEFEFIHPDFREIAKERTRKREHGEYVPDRYEMKIRKKNGETRWIDHSGRAVSHRGEMCVVGTAIDITENRQMRDALKLSEERHRLLADNSLDVIWTMDINGRMTYVSPSVQKLRGYSPEEVMQQPMEKLLTHDSLVIVQEGLKMAREAVEKGLPYSDFRADLEQPCKDGTTVWTETTVTGMYNEKNEFVGMLGVTRDITQRKHFESSIAEMKKYDSVTGLPRREFFTTRLENEIEAAKLVNGSGGLLVVGLDGFKNINETFGFSAGDLVLKKTAERLKEAREADVSRIGGDEFAVLLARVSCEANALERAENIRKMFEEPFYVEGYDLSLTVSIGISIFPEQGTNEIVLLKNAENALETAKRNGRNRCEIYIPDDFI